MSRIRPLSRNRLALAASFLLVGAIVVVVPWRLVAQDADQAAQPQAATKADDVAKAEQMDRMIASVKKMKDIALALLIFENKNKHFPPAVMIGPDGKTPHSWRVEMLPYLGRQHEFDTYKMDEPWDSENNLVVAKAVADLFTVPGNQATGECGYFLLTGPSTPFDGEKTTKIRAITDGTTNTVGVVEGKRQIPWTKPEEIQYDNNKPLPDLGGFFDDGFHVGFLDGSVVFLPKEIDEKTLRAMITFAGRERAKRSSASSWPELVK